MVRLEEFEAECGKRCPAIGQAWRRAWEHVVPFFAFASGIRKMIYTTTRSLRTGPRARQNPLVSLWAGRCPKAGPRGIARPGGRTRRVTDPRK